MLKKKTKEYLEISVKAKEGINLVHQLKQQWEEAKHSLGEAKAEIDDCEKRNIIISSVKKDFKEANNFFENGDYVKSKELADKVLNYALTTQKVWTDAKSSLDRVFYVIDDANSKGIQLIWTKDEIKKAEHLFESGKYYDSVTIIKQIIDNVKETENKYELASNLIKETKSLLDNTKPRNIPTPDDLFQDAITAFQNQRYDDTIDYMMTTRHKIEKAISQQENAKFQLNMCTEKIENARQYIFIDEVKEMLDKANKAFDEGEFDRSISLARSCEEETRRLISEGEPIISVALPADNLQARIFNRCTLTVTNNGKVHVREVEITLEGKIEVEGLSTIPFLKANQSQSIEIALKADVEGSLPVKIDLKFINEANNYPYTFQESTWLSIGTVTPSLKTSETKLLRETEFFRGFIRMKVAVKNDMPSVITDVSFKPIVDEKVFRLSHIEPDYIIKLGEIQLGNVNPKEKKTVAIYFDPMICTTSNINGTISYKDAGGNFSTRAMKSKEVNVICPIFFTEDTANPAMLKNLVKNVLNFQDSKVFNIPQGLSPTKAFEITKEAIQQRDIKYIRDFHQKSPYIAEAWYYGVTKVKQNQMVIRCDVREDTNSIQIFVASSDERALVGLLAELGHNLDSELKEKGITQPIQQITNITIKDSIVQRSSLLFGTESKEEEIVEGSVSD